MSGTYYPTLLTNLIEYIVPSTDCYLTTTRLQLWYICDAADYCRTNDECKSVCRSIYNLLFFEKYEPTKNELNYIRRKIVYQKLFDIDTSTKLPNYVYIYLNIIHTMMEKKRRKLLKNK